MPRISFSSYGDSPFQNLLGHNPAILKCWNELESAFTSSPTLSPELKEEIRRTLAHLNQCHYCMAKGIPSDNFQDARTEKAIAFAKCIWRDHQELSEKAVEELKSSFTDAEISELCALICFLCACQKFGSALGLKAACKVSFIN